MDWILIIPNLIVEILSPSNQTHDLITKLNLYMNYGVKEYWIVNPILNTVSVYALNEEDMYIQHNMKTEIGSITSKFLHGLSIDLSGIFSWELLVNIKYLLFAAFTQAMGMIGTFFVSGKRHVLLPYGSNYA